MYILKSVNKIALNCNDDKRLSTFDKITTYPYGYKGNHVKDSVRTPKI